MYMLLEMCCVCLANTNNLKQIDILDIDNIKIVRKLEYCTSKCKNIRPAIPLYICSKCCQELRIAYEFKKSYYQSCKLLKGYVSQLKRNKRCHNNAAGKRLQQELQVKITDLGECMIDGQVARDLVQIENIETQCGDMVPEPESLEIVTNITSTDSIMVNNLVEEHLDTDDLDMNVSEENEDMCEISVDNKNGNTFLNLESSVVQQNVEIIHDIVLDNEELDHKAQLNLILAGIAKTEDTGDVCKIWVENTNNQDLNNITDTGSSIILNESAHIKEEIIVPENTNHNLSEIITDTVSSININESKDIEEEIIDTQKETAHVKQKHESSRKKMKYSNMLTETSYEENNNNDIRKCMHCNKYFTYKTDLLNFLTTHSGNRPFCSTFCRQQYNKMCALRK